MNLDLDKSSKKKTQVIAIILVVLISIVLGLLILKADNPKTTVDEHEGHSEEEGHSDNKSEALEDETINDDQAKNHGNEHDEFNKELTGPHGGKLFVKDGYGLEIVMYEKDITPEFRIYTYINEEALSPEESKVSVELQRLGKEPELLNFAKQGDYLKSVNPIDEPHSFKVKINTIYDNKKFIFGYEKIENRILMSDKQLKLNGVSVLTASPIEIKNSFKFQGEIKLNADNSVQVVSRVGGIVEIVNANAGDEVKKGQVLAVVSSQVIADIRGDLLAAQKRVNLSRKTYDREKKLWEEKISAEQDYLQAENDLREAEINFNRLKQKLSVLGTNTNGAGQASYEVRSPISGTVTIKNVSNGQVVRETDSLYEVADLSTVWAEISIYAKDINNIKSGQEVTVKASDFKAQTQGNISYVGSLVGEKSRTAMARVVINNPDRTWRPGLPVNIELTTDEIEVPIAVSVESIQTLNDEKVVFVNYGDFFEARPVTLGREDGEFVEVLKGLNVGEKYAAVNSYLIKADIGKAGASHDH